MKTDTLYRVTPIFPATMIHATAVLRYLGDGLPLPPCGGGLSFKNSVKVFRKFSRFFDSNSCFVICLFVLSLRFVCGCTCLFREKMLEFARFVFDVFTPFVFFLCKTWIFLRRSKERKLTSKFRGIRGWLAFISKKSP